MNDRERFFAYCGLCRRLNVFFDQHVAAYCRNCQQVLRRLPTGSESYKLVAGVFPGCCHRGAGDIFRLEGVGPDERLSPGITALLREARNDRMKAMEAFEPLYVLENCRTGERLTGEHCRYFGDRGCRLEELKGPLCLNFICPPIRGDLLAAAGGREDLVGPEHDFLGIYQLLSVLGSASKTGWQRAAAAFERRLAALEEACEQLVADRRRKTLYDCFWPAA